VEVHQQVDVVALAVELRQLALNLVTKAKWACRAKTQCLPVLMFPCSVINHGQGRGVRFRYNFRLHPTPGSAPRRPVRSGAQVVFDDGLRVRRQAGAAGLPYVSDGELSRRVITEAKKTPERAWLGEVSAVVLQQALADPNAACARRSRPLRARRRGRATGPRPAPGSPSPSATPGGHSW